MANDTVITIIGNTTAPAELRFTPAGAAVVNFTVASTPRTFDRNSNEWKDGTTLFMRCSAWREMAENIAESLDKPGTRVVVVGRLTQREYEKDGQKRTVIELEADEVAPSLKYATAKVAKTQRKDGNGGQDYSKAGVGFGGQQQAPATSQGGWGGQPQNSGGWGAPDGQPAF